MRFVTNQEGYIEISTVASCQNSNAEVTSAEITSAKSPLRTQPAHLMLEQHDSSINVNAEMGGRSEQSSHGRSRAVEHVLGVRRKTPNTHTLRHAPYHWMKLSAST